MSQPLLFIYEHWLRGRNLLARRRRRMETLPHVAIKEVTLRTSSPNTMTSRLFQSVNAIRIVWRVARIVILAVASSKAV